MESETDQTLLVNVSPEKSDHLKKQGTTCFPYRYQLLILSFWGFFSALSIRTSFNIALVDMVNYTSTSNYTSDECSETTNHVPNSTLKQHGGGEFNWGSSMQSLLLGAFFYGYVLSQLVGGYFAEVFGPKKIFCMTVFLPCFLSILSPWAAQWSPIALFFTRVLMGISQGPLFPSNSALWSRWAPASEFTIMYGICAAGATFGSVAGPFITGLLCNLKFLDGWPLSFYLFGLLGLVWSILWICCAYDGPENHPSLSIEEKRLICEGRSYSPQNTSFKRPVVAILSSKCFWGALIYFFFEGLAYFFLNSGVPIYMRQILRFDIAENGFLNAVPYIGMMVFNVIGSISADWIRKRYLSTKNTRKLFTILGDGLPAIIILGMGFIPCNRTIAVVLYTAAMTINGVAVAGPQSNLFDIAPKYAGTLMGVCNLVGNTGGFLSPLIVGAITKDSPSRSDWQKVFFLTSGCYFVGTLAFVLLGDGVEQPWAKDDYVFEKKTSSNSNSSNINTKDDEDTNHPLLK